MTRYRTRILLVILVGLVSLCGAQCSFLAPPQDDVRRLPPALAPSPTLQQIIAVVNANSSRIRSFSTSQASVSMQGFPTLRANIAFERPMRFRLRADLPLAGQEVDVGSNDELFWFWSRHNEPAALYYCRHDQFASSPARRNLIIDPYWLVEAMGLATLDPALTHQGPIVRQDGALEIHTALNAALNAAQGPAKKITILEPRQGLVLAQYLYDSRGQVLASAIAGRYRQDPLSGLFMPTVVDIQTGAAQSGAPLKLRIDLGAVEINRPIANSGQLWMMPAYPNWPAIDLCSAAAPAAARGMPGATPSGSPSAAPASIPGAGGPAVPGVMPGATPGAMPSVTPGGPALSTPWPGPAAAGSGFVPPGGWTGSP